MAQIDLDSMSRKELEKLRGDIDRAITRVEKRERKEALEAAQKAAAEYGFSLEELSGGAGPANGTRRSGQRSAARYRNPENSADTWTGKGRKPKWFIQAIENGTDPADMEI